MSTICLEIQRANAKSVCVRYAAIDAFSEHREGMTFSKHLPFGYTGEPYVEKDGIRYLYLVTFRDRGHGGIETIVCASSSRKDAKRRMRLWKRGWKTRMRLGRGRVIALPAWNVTVEHATLPDGRPFDMKTISPRDMGDEIRLRCTVKANAEHQIYGSYRKIPEEEISERDELGIPKSPRYAWVPPVEFRAGE